MSPPIALNILGSLYIISRVYGVRNIVWNNELRAKRDHSKNEVAKYYCLCSIVPSPYCSLVT